MRTALTPTYFPTYKPTSFADEIIQHEEIKKDRPLRRQCSFFRLVCHTCPFKNCSRRPRILTHTVVPKKPKLGGYAS